MNGTDLESATALWTSFSGVIQAPGERAEKRAVFHFPSLVPVGIFAARIFGSNGVSEPHLFLIDDLPSLAESQTNKSRATAQRIEVGSSVEGTSNELGFDWFRFHANKGERVTSEVVASRLGSRLDSVLRVTDANGRQMAHVDDVPGLRGDSYVSFIATNTGEYFIELRDVNYGGGSEFSYRLRVGDFPLATAAYPPATSQNAISMFRLAGPVGDVGRTEARTTGSTSIPLAIRGRNGSAFAKALVTSGREILEAEPNGAAPKSTNVAWNDGLNGRFDKPNDRDYYEFNVQKGERLEFRAATRSLGAPCDAVLEIQSADGKTLARSNPSSADEGIVTHKFATDGNYRLVVEELSSAFGANCVYRITAQRAAGFALNLETDRVNVEAGKPFDLKVTCARGDYKGPVTLSVDGLENLAITNNVIGEGKTNVTMKINVPDSLVPGTPAFLGVAGSAERDGSEVRARASTAPALRRRFPQMLHVPAELDGEVALGISAR